MDEHETSNDHDTLDSIIKLINTDSGGNNLTFNSNYQSERLVPIAAKLYKNSNNLSHQKSELNISATNTQIVNNNNNVQNLKTLKFKPWSGIVGSGKYDERFDEIREEIVGEVGDVVGEVDEEEEQTERGTGRKEETGEKQVQQTNEPIIQNGYYYKFQNGTVKLIKQLLEQNGFKNTPQYYQDWTMYWSCGPVKLQIYPQLNPYQKVNHFPNSFQITRKDLMNKNISKMQIKYGYSHFNFLPKTFILPLEMSQFEQEYNKNKKIYIVKPHNRSQGKGIIVTEEIETIYARLEKYSSLVVSEYIDNPLLINGYKFDLRIYVGITSIYPLRIYVYEQGLARFATERYNNEMGEQRKNFRHLTNYSVNKKNENFVSSAETGEDYFGSKWALTSLKDFLEFNIGKNETTQLFERIDDLVIKTILSIENLLFTNVTQYVPYINNCFEILGFDVLIDSTLKPWLVEVNLSPSMNTDSPLDLKIKGNVVSDMFTMLGVMTHSERYINNGHLRNLTTKHVNARGNENQLEAFEKYVIKEMESEEKSRGGWKRVFPAANAYKYAGFFEVDRYLNIIARESIKEVYGIRTLVPRMDIMRHRGSVPAEIRIRSNTKDKTKDKEKSSSKNFIAFEERKSVKLQRFVSKRPYLKFRIR